MIVYGDGLRPWLEGKLGDKIAGEASSSSDRVLKENDAEPVAAIVFAGTPGKILNWAWRLIRAVEHRDCCVVHVQLHIQRVPVQPRPSV